MLEMASWLVGDREGARKVTLTKGTALADSADGCVEVDLGGDVVAGDGMQGIIVPTTVDVRAGDTVTAALDGADGTAKAPSVVGVVGGGDRTKAAISAAQSDATKANAGIADELKAREAAIGKVQSDIDAYKKSAAATYATTESVDEKNGAITRTLDAEYTKTADLASTDAVKDAKKAGTDAQSALDAYKSKVSETYVEQATFTTKVDELSSTMSGNYSDFETYEASNDKAVAEAKKAGTDAQSSIDAYKASNDAAISSIQTDYVTKTAFDQSNTAIKASVSDSLTQAKTYTDGQVKTEATNRDAAIKASADGIRSTVTEQIGTTSDALQADIDAKTLVVDVRATPGGDEQTANTVAMTATVRRGSDALDTESIARLGTIAWYVGGTRMATGPSYSATAGQAVECRLEA